MKQRIILPLIFILLLLLAAACKKEEVQPMNPPPPTTGEIYFKNTQAHPYTIYIDGTSQGILNSGVTSNGYTLPANTTHTLKAEQYNGYILYPTIFTCTVSITAGGASTWSF